MSAAMRYSMQLSLGGEGAWVRGEEAIMGTQHLGRAVGGGSAVCGG